jgi:HD-GYP domain-containing protein (c-di-GMP phosphodiesterase class II)
LRDAIREIRDAAGTQFCPEVVGALVRIVERDASELGTTAGAEASD